MRTGLRAEVATAAALLAVSVGGCGTAGLGANKVGAPVQPVTLTMADEDHGDDLGTILSYVREVSRLSHGAVKIQLVPVQFATPDYEQRVVRQTAAGRFDLAYVGGRVLDTVGVPAAAALQVPFLIDSYPLEAKVVSGSVGERIVRAMSAGGVAGVALLGDHLRYIVTRTALTGPAELSGVRMRSYGSRSMEAAWRALGAVPVNMGGNTPNAIEAMRAGKLFGLETDPVLYSDNAPVGPVIQAGVPVWPHVLALFASAARFRALPPATRGLLRTAAADVNRTLVRTMRVADNAAFATICRRGAYIARLTAPQQAAFERAGIAASERVAVAPAARALVAKITALKGSAAPEPAPTIPANCPPGGLNAPGIVADVHDGAVAASLAQAFRPGSVFRSLIDYGIVKRILGAEQARNNAGTFTWHFTSPGHFYFVQQPLLSNPSETRTPGIYTIRGNTMRMVFDPGTAPGHETVVCKPPTQTTIDCRIVKSDDGFLPPFYMAGMTAPLTRIGG